MARCRPSPPAGAGTFGAPLYLIAALVLFVTIVVLNWTKATLSPRSRPIRRTGSSVSTYLQSRRKAAGAQRVPASAFFANRRVRPPIVIAPSGPARSWSASGPSSGPASTE